MSTAKDNSGFVNITTATTTVVKKGFGRLKSVIVNKPVANAVITIYNNTEASGAKIGTITLPATLLQDVENLNYDCEFSTGLTIVTSAATDITVVYQ